MFNRFLNYFGYGTQSEHASSETQSTNSVSIDEIKEYFSTPVAIKTRSFTCYGGNGCKYLNIDTCNQHVDYKISQSDFSHTQHEYHTQQFQKYSDVLSEMYKGKTALEFYIEFKDVKIFGRWNFIDSCCVSRLNDCDTEVGDFHPSLRVDKPRCYPFKNGVLFNVFENKTYDLSTSIINSIYISPQVFQYVEFTDDHVSLV
jgi:hypothetical protein